MGTGKSAVPSVGTVSLHRGSFAPGKHFGGFTSVGKYYDSSPDGGFNVVGLEVGIISLHRGSGDPGKH